MLRFDGRVALVTGAGRGLGRAHALFLASRGAAVVVNDLGSAGNGDGASNQPAREVVAEIVAAGGQAVASFASVADAPEAIVETALERFGRLDVVVNNAGFNRAAAIDDPDLLEQVRRHMSVHFFGTVGVTAAAWPHLVRSGSGRIVNTVSPTVFGLAQQAPYVAAKGAILALTRSVALEGTPVGIRVNAIAPTAATRMSDEMEAPDEIKQWLRDTMPTSLVSPLVAYLAHEECGVNGESLLVAGGKVQRMTLGHNDGFVDASLTPESIQAHLEEILDPSSNLPVSALTPDNL